MRMRTGRFVFWEFFFLGVFFLVLVNLAGMKENSEANLLPVTFLLSQPDYIERAPAAVSIPARREETASRENIFSHRVDRPVLLSPLAEARLTSPFGRRGEKMHWGIDLAASEGKPVRAAAAGQVIFAGWSTGYGLLVVLEHKNFRTYYAHNSVLMVKNKDKVAAGEVISAVGRTGRATGNHLHFELEIAGEKVNPLPYFKSPVLSRDK